MAKTYDGQTALSGLSPATEGNEWREEDGVIYFSVENEGGTTEVAVLKGMLFNEDDRATKNIRAYAGAFRTPNGCRLITPNAKLNGLIRKKFTDKKIEDMDLWCIVVMHELINDSDGVRHLLDTERSYFARMLYNLNNDIFKWDRDYGFAFEVLPH